MSTVDKKSHEGEAPVRLCNYTDVYYNDEITGDIDFMPATASFDQVSRFTVTAGDVPITKDSETSNDIGRPSFVPKTLPGIVYGYHLAIYRPLDTLTGPFIRYVFEASSTRGELELRTPGVTRVGLSRETLRNLRVPFPGPVVARAVADYLDHETAEIDALIVDLDQFGGLLAERHYAMATKLFASIDSETRPRPLGTMATFISGGTPDPAVERFWADADSDVAFRWVAISDMSGTDTVVDTAKSLTPMGLADRRLQVAPPGTVLFAMYASVGEVARLATQATFNQAIIGITPYPNVLDPTYLQRYLESARPELLAEVRSNTQANLNAHQVRHFVIPTPEFPIQQQIAADIEFSLATLRSAQADLTRAIALAKERRAALITAAVTGQIDVTAKHRPAAEQLEDDIKELT
ncbi:restriction endonuclease subunit S [Brachybacterium muris]|uniref:restriction endonuclease subunit S n=1 Tax=Brachybacterium muris TaxID=219301 RepID=UPI00223BE240|nr:restriction endonuclease subunit S [Brachybacterium muris]